MFRKCLSFLCCFLLICNVTFATALPDISADGAILIETNTNTILYAKNCNLPFYPASTTKILTSLAIAQDLAMNQTITKSQSSIENVPSDSSQIGLNVGAQYSVYDGLHAVLMSSDNFVCYDLALADSGSIDIFAKRMNSLAAQCGANNYNFVNPHGYHDENHYVTPYSLAKIAQQAFSNPIVAEIAGTQTYDFHVLNTGETIPLKHTASLLDPSSKYYNKNVVAAKTGYHTPAGRTLVARATYDDIDLIGVVMRTDAPLQFEDMNKLFEYGANNFSLKTADDGSSYLDNATYSAWAKPYIEEALAKGWITNTSHNYTTTITKREFISLLRGATNDDYNATLDVLFQYSEPSIYLENLPIKRGELAKIVANYLNHYELHVLPTHQTISDIDDLSPDLQDAINFCYQANLISLQDGNQFKPNATISYEEVLCIISKLNSIIERYNSFSL